jgi:hypothetical protein
MKKILMITGLLISTLGLVSKAQPTAFWTEGFDNCGSSPCAANTYSGTNGAWTFSTDGNDGDAPNAFYASCQESGYTNGGCGSACIGGIPPPGINPTGASMHISSLLFGDLGAAYYSGSGVAGTLDATTVIRAESPFIDCSGKANLQVSFTYIENGDGGSDNATLWYFDGNTWIQISDMAKTSCCGNQPCDGTNKGQWTSVTALLPASAANNSQVKIGFRWANNNDGVGTDPSFAFDNVAVSEGLPPSNNTITIVSGPTSSLCAGSEFQVNYNTTGLFNPGNIFSVILSDPNGSFISSQAIGQIPAINSGSITALLPNNVFGSPLYRIQIASTSPATISNNIQIDVLDNPIPVITPSGPTTFCEGEAVTLSASFGDSFLWYNGETTQDITVFESTSDIFVKITYGNGCSATSGLLNVTVNPTPGRPSILPSGGLCSNDPISLSASPNTGILWSTGDTTETISVDTPGLYTLTFTDSLGCSNFTEYEVIAGTNPDAPNLGGPYNTCGTDVTLDAGSYTDPVSYLWSTGETTQSIVVSSTNNYSVVVTNAAGCTAEGSADVIISPVPASDITNSLGTTPLCSGATAILSVVSLPGASYLWSTGETTSSITITTGGQYDVTVTSGNGCSSNSSINVTEINCVPPTQLRSLDCGNLTFNLSSSIIADAVTGATQYEFEFRNAAGTTVLASALNPTRTLLLSTVNPAIQWNTQYSVKVRAYTGAVVGPFGASCIIGTIPNPNNTVPNTKLRTADCGNTSLSLTSIIQADAVTGATQYEFQFSQGSTVVLTRLIGSRQLNLSGSGLNWGNTYTVRVRAYIGTLQGNYGSQCTIGIICDPAICGVPTTQLVAGNCGRLTYNYSTGSCAATAVASASSYIFEFLQNNVVVGTRNSPTRVCVFNQVLPALNPLQTYQCRVKVVISGVVGNPGPSCLIGFAAGTRFDLDSDDEAGLNEENLAGSELEVSARPNPFTGQTQIQLMSASEFHAIRIFDMGGKLVHQETINGANQFLVGSSLVRGIYILEVADSFGNVSRQRLIKSED